MSFAHRGSSCLTKINLNTGQTSLKPLIPQSGVRVIPSTPIRWLMVTIKTLADRVGRVTGSWFLV